MAKAHMMATIMALTTVLIEGCPQSSLPPSRPFLIIGHSGGNPNLACENTLESTMAGLGSGMNAVELDISLSKDNELFLWHDPDPWTASALARRLGIGLPGRCKPSLNSNTKAITLTMAEINSNFGYEDRNVDKFNIVPTLDEWLTIFSHEPRLRVIWLDIKVEETHLLEIVVLRLKGLFNKHNVDLKRMLMSVSDDKRAEIIRTFLHKHDLDGTRVFSDTVSKHLYVFRPKKLNGVAKALSSCSCCANLGAAPLAANRWSALQTTIRFNVMIRDKLGRLNRKSVYVWTIDDEEEMKWIVDAGVDGIITNRPDLLAKIVMG